MNNSCYLKSNQVMRCIGMTVILFFAGCASTPAPVEQMAVSRAAVAAASSSGANEFAPVPLKSAMDKMERAEKAMAARDYVVARKLAEEAQVDARLATATADSAKARKAADELRESTSVLKKEIDRKSEQPSK